ncbi:MAG: hypothetical protein ACE5J7_00445 [Candidatus Aenigmatarchaeota archaeon]
MTRYGTKLYGTYSVISEGLLDGDLESALLEYSTFNNYTAFFRDLLIRHYPFYVSQFFEGERKALFAISKDCEGPKVTITGFGDQQLVAAALDDIYDKTAIEEDNSVTVEELKRRMDSVTFEKMGRCMYPYLKSVL